MKKLLTLRRSVQSILSAKNSKDIQAFCGGWFACHCSTDL